MRVYVESLLPCDAARAWDAVETCALLREVSYPMVTFRPLPGESFPERWSVGQVVRVRSRLFGFLPMGTRTLRFERVDAAVRQIQTRESDLLIPRWDHLITVTPVDESHCRYRDEIEIEAGWRTFFVWLFAYTFYKHRQRRLRRVARRLVNESASN